MSAGVNDLRRRLDERGMPYVESSNGHEITWTHDGSEWMYCEELYSGRPSFLRIRDISPWAVAELMDGRCGR